MFLHSFPFPPIFYWYSWVSFDTLCCNDVFNACNSQYSITVNQVRPDISDVITSTSTFIADGKYHDLLFYYSYIFSFIYTINTYQYIRTYENGEDKFYLSKIIIKANDLKSEYSLERLTDISHKVININKLPLIVNQNN